MPGLIGFAIGFVILIIIGRILSLPIRRIVALMGNALIGGLTLGVFNIIGGFTTQLQIDITILNSILVGILGLPGLIIILLMQLPGKKGMGDEAIPMIFMVSNHLKILFRSLL